jgi:hypothetical protein
MFWHSASRVETGSANWPLRMVAPSLLSGGDDSRRNPIVVQRVIDIDVRTDNLHAAMV